MGKIIYFVIGAVFGFIIAGILASGKQADGETYETRNETDIDPF